MKNYRLFEVVFIDDSELGTRQILFKTQDGHFFIDDETENDGRLIQQFTYDEISNCDPQFVIFARPVNMRQTLDS
ncbi:hypothetical protein [Enterococcus sp. DIV0800]|uniref:hypothetical protein n=1 Tax=unclassified Enterococcus TaxID=2608891 RepID=UPI003D2FBA1A